MLRVNLAAAFFVTISCITAQAMTFADRPGTRPGLTAEEKTIFNFEHRPGHVTNVRTGSIDRRQIQAARPRLSWSGPMQIEQRRARPSALGWPSLKPPPAVSAQPQLRPLYRRLPITPPAGTGVTFADRPGLTIKLASPIEVLAPFGLAEFCAAGKEECSYSAFARRRAVLMPFDEDRLLSTPLSSVEPLALPHFRRAPKRWHLAVAADDCAGSQPKRSYLECVGLPGNLLKNKSDVASPLYTRAGLIPRGGGHYKLGKPYRVSGRLYRPRENPEYVATGKASWYGADFHGRMTANGEWFDMDYLSAAHATLPLPSYAHVTNLENGKEMIVRVNDRGPFVDGRIIDLSKRAAEILNFRKQGIAKVRVQYVGPAPLDDRGLHLAAMNHELGRGTPVDRIIAQANGLHQQAALLADPQSSFTE
jgi:rare lipoprotein A (peptidoglycan hydrolase)